MIGISSTQRHRGRAATRAMRHPDRCSRHPPYRSGRRARPGGCACVVTIRAAGSRKGFFNHHSRSLPDGGKGRAPLQEAAAKLRGRRAAEIAGKVHASGSDQRALTPARQEPLVVSCSLYHVGTGGATEVRHDEAERQDRADHRLDGRRRPPGGEAARQGRCADPGAWPQPGEGRARRRRHQDGGGSAELLAADLSALAEVRRLAAAVQRRDGSARHPDQQCRHRHRGAGANGDERRRVRAALRGQLPRRVSADPSPAAADQAAARRRASSMCRRPGSRRSISAT